MTIGWPILSAIIFLPLLGALFILAIRGEDEIAIRNARYVALWTTMITFLLSLVIWIESTRQPMFSSLKRSGNGSATRSVTGSAWTVSPCCSSFSPLS